MLLQCGEGRARKHSSDSRGGIASRGAMKRECRCSSPVRSSRGPSSQWRRDRCNPSGAAVPASCDAAARALWAEHAVESRGVSVQSAFQGAPWARQCLRYAWRDVTTFVLVTACHPRYDVATYRSSLTGTIASEPSGSPSAPVAVRTRRPQRRRGRCRGTARGVRRPRACQAPHAVNAPMGCWWRGPGPVPAMRPPAPAA